MKGPPKDDPLSFEENTMPEGHDTRAHTPVDGGTTICGVHEGCMDNVFKAIDKVKDSTMSRTMGMWVVAVCMTVAGAFGMWIWNRCDGVEQNNHEIEKTMVKVKADVEHIKVVQNDMKYEQRQMREDMKKQFEKLRALIKNGN